MEETGKSINVLHYSSFGFFSMALFENNSSDLTINNLMDEGFCDIQNNPGRDRLFTVPYFSVRS